MWMLEASPDLLEEQPVLVETEPTLGIKSWHLKQRGRQ